MSWVVLRRVALLGLLIVTASCASARQGRASDPAIPDPDAVGSLGGPIVAPRVVASEAGVRALTEARRLAGLGRRVEAFRCIVAAADAEPLFLEGERFLQDLLTGTKSDVWLRGRYDRILAERPGDPDAYYLAARVETEPERQASLLRSALAADPTHPWARLGFALALDRAERAKEGLRIATAVVDDAPWFTAGWYYLGARAYGRGAPDAAERFFAEAVRRAPEEGRPWSALATVRDELGRSDDASSAALEGLRRCVGDSGIASSVVRVLLRHGARRDLETALGILEAARPSCGDPAMVETLRGRLLLALSRPHEAEDAFVAARRLGAAPGEIAVSLRRARIASGNVGLAVREYLQDLPGGMPRRDDERAAAWEELLAATPDWDAAPSPSARLARALIGVGWLDEAGDVLRTARRSWPHDARLASLSRELASSRMFLRDLGEVARDLRRAHRKASEVPLDTVLDRIRGLAAHHGLSPDASDGLNVRKYAFVGAFAGSEDSSGAFRSLFRDRGLSLVVGQRSGQATELIVGRMVSRRSDVHATVVGDPVVYDETWIETEGLPEGLGGFRGGLAGLTLDREVLIHLDVIRRADPPDELDLPYMPRAAHDEVGLRALDTPSDVARRIETRLVTELGRSGADWAQVDAVIRHERIHVRDAARMLPLWRHPIAAAKLGFGHGFDPHAIECTLEGRAAVGALADADEPRAALASLLSFLPHVSGDNAHATGYRNVVAVAVEIVLADHAAFPSVNRGWNIVEQLDKLTRDEARELGRRLAARFCR